MFRFFHLLLLRACCLGMVGAALWAGQAVAQPATPIAQHLQRSEQLLAANNPAAAQWQAEQALHLAAAGGGRAEEAAAYSAVGRALQAQGHYDQALAQLRRSLHLYQQLRNPLGQAQALRLLGQAQVAQGDTGQALGAYRQALRLARPLRNPAELALLYGRWGELHAAQQQWEQALDRQEQAYAQWHQAANAAGQTAALNAIGLAHYELRHYSRALYYLQRALAQARQLNDSTRTGEALASIGKVYEDVGNYGVALGFYTQALSQLPGRASPRRRAQLLAALAVVYDSVGNQPAAIRALQRALQRALPLARRRPRSWAQLSELYQRLTDVYRRQGDYAQALAAQGRYVALQDSAFLERRTAQIAELQTRYETEKKEREIQLLTKDRQIQQANLRRQKLLGNVLAVGALLLLLAVAALYRAQRQQARVNRLLQLKNQAISRQKEELGRLNRTKDTLFSVISHDLRSPLSSLSSLFSLLSMGTLPPERLGLHAARLTRTLDSTLRLLDNLLNWSAAQMQGAAVRPERLHLETMTEEALALLLGDAERKSILLISQLPHPCLVRADPNMLRLVLRNLLSNAIKFTPEHGTVTVAARRLDGQETWEISVMDTGVGIAPDDLPKVFGEGGHHTTLGTALEKGTGLGLRLCKEFVERNGGRIHCESQPGAGSTFRFTLPAGPPETVPLVPPAAPATVAAAG